MALGYKAKATGKHAIAILNDIPKLITPGEIVVEGKFAGESTLTISFNDPNAEVYDALKTIFQKIKTGNGEADEA